MLSFKEHKTFSKVCVFVQRHLEWEMFGLDMNNELNNCFNGFPKVMSADYRKMSMFSQMLMPKTLTLSILITWTFSI